MKKLLSLVLSVVLLLSFAACGGDSDKETDGSDASKGSAAGVTSIKFDKESYTVEVEGYITLSEFVTVEPAGSALKFSSSDETIAEVSSSKKGEFMGVKTGEVTVTATSEDGSVSATCKLVVAGLGTVVARNGTEGGITHKRWGAVERPDDANAKIVVIPKDLAEGTDMSKAVSFDYGEPAADNSCAVAYEEGYYVAKTGDTGNYELKGVPEGDYVGLIVCSRDYTANKKYSKDTALATFKSSAIAKYFTDAEINTIVDSIYQLEFYVGEFTVRANEITVFGHDFAPDLDE